MSLRVLLWKDARLFGDVFAAGLALLIGSYLMAFLQVYADSQGGFEWSKAIAGGASLTRFTSVLICALLGAYAFAREKEERSLLFLATLPARRRDIIVSKATIAAALFIALWVVSLALLLAGLRAMGCEWSALLLTLEAMLAYIASGVMAFGVAWLLSLFMETSIGAAFAGLMALIPVYTAQLAINWYFQIENRMFFHPAVVAFMAATGLAGVAAGAAIYARFGSAPEEARRKFALPWRGNARRDDVEEAWALSASSVKKAGAARALLWKDVQILRSAFVIGIATLALPYAVAIAGQGRPEYFRMASVISAGLGAIIFTFWSGHIMSAEMASRTAQFLAALPARRAEVIASKLAIVLAPMLLVVAVNAAVLIAAHNRIAGEVPFDARFTWAAWPDAPFIVAGLSLVNDAAIGCATAWFLAAWYKKPAAAIVVGVMVAFAGMAIWAALSTACSEMEKGPSPLQFVRLFSLGTAALVAALFAAGSIVAARHQPHAE